MAKRALLLIFSFGIALGAMALTGWAQTDAEQVRPASEMSATRAELARARKAAQEASGRVNQFQAEANNAQASADKAVREMATLAARIQLAEAEIIESQARLALISDQRLVLDSRLAAKQQPLVRLTAALQNMARRPLTLSALRPGSLGDTVHVRAVLESTVPEIRRRTATLRSELARQRELEGQARAALDKQRGDERDWRDRRRALAALEVKQRDASRRANRDAMRENERALALGEQARDLDELVDELDRAGALRRELAALSGPIIRPQRPDASQVVAAAQPVPTPTATAPPAGLRLPVLGRTLIGFGATNDVGLESRGITLAPRGGAQIVSPARGRVAFAGPYRGFGQIVIVEHANGWTSLVTGLARTSV
ncbi:MAG: metalloendopeptidase, partial [Alphaproteobacteria bacterium]